MSIDYELLETCRSYHAFRLALCALGVIAGHQVASTVEHQREVRALNAKLADKTAALEAMTKKLEAADQQLVELSAQLAEPPVRKGCWN